MGSKVLPIFTIQTFNQNALQAIGAVFAQQVEGVPISITPGRNPAMEQKIADLTKALKEQLNTSALSSYPKALALVDLKISFTEIGSSGQNILLLGQATATALTKKASKPPSNRVNQGSASGPMQASGPMPLSQGSMANLFGSSSPLGQMPAPDPFGSLSPAPMAPPMAPPMPAPMPVPNLGPISNMSIPKNFQRGGTRNRRRANKSNKRGKRRYK
jgi:hypothetical protein